MLRRYPALALAALIVAVPPLAAQVTPPNPFAVERADRAPAGHPREWRHHRPEKGRFERRRERLEREGHEHRGRVRQRTGDRLQRGGGRMEHRRERPDGHRHPVRRRQPEDAI